MNTLSKQITPLLFKQEARQNGHNDIKALWKKFQDDKKPLSLEHHILYAVLRGKDWRKVFTPITNEVKLANGLSADYSLREALWRLKARMDVFEDFKSLIDPSKCATLVRQLIAVDITMGAYDAQLAGLLLENAAA